MAYDHDLTDRFRAALGSRLPYEERRMMGAVCFLLHGHMIGGCHRTKRGARRFFFRIGKQNTEIALARGGAEAMAHGGRPMGGFVTVEDADASPEALHGWIGLAVAYVETLPPK